MSKIILIFLLMFLVLFSFLNTISLSLNDGFDSAKGGITMYPRAFSLKNYEYVFKNEFFPVALKNSLIRVLTGVILQTFCTLLLAYVLSRKEFILRRPVTIAYALAIVLDAGLLPVYFLYRKLGLINNTAVYWLPGLVPVIVTIAILNAASQWNSIWDTLVFTTKIDFTTVQPIGVRSALCVISAFPMILHAIGFRLFYDKSPLFMIKKRDWIHNQSVSFIRR